MRREDLPWLHALTTPPLHTGNARRLAQEGVRDPDAAVAALVRALENGPLPRRGLALAGVPPGGVGHVLFLAALRGLIVRGPGDAHVLAADWLGPQPAVDRNAALRELGRRFVAARPGADDRDLAKWAGLPLRDARAALRSAKPVSYPDFADRPRLLGAFDEVLMGWRDRSWILGDHAEAVIAGGIFRPVALVGGRTVATWRLERGRVAYTALEPFDEGLLDAEAADVIRFLGA